VAHASLRGERVGCISIGQHLGSWPAFLSEHMLCSNCNIKRKATKSSILCILHGNGVLVLAFLHILRPLILPRHDRDPLTVDPFLVPEPFDVFRFDKFWRLSQLPGYHWAPHSSHCVYHGDLSSYFFASLRPSSAQYPTPKIDIRQRRGEDLA